MQLPRLLVESVSRDGPPERAAWLAALPGLVASYAARWRLAVGEPYQPGGANSWVAPAVRGAERLVLKLTWSADPRSESRDEADGLRAWDGRGTVRLLGTARDAPTTALLLEACEPGTPLASALPPLEQDAVMADVLRRLWIAPPDGSAFRPLAEMCAWWADSAEARLPFDPLVRDGLALFRTLPIEPSEPVVLVTDLHGGNVLAARREPWLVIDPKPYVGDRHYDPVQHLLNHPDRLAADPLALVRRMAALLDLDADRLRLWLGARCVVESPARPELAEVAARLLR